MQYFTEAQMKNEPVLVRHFSLNQEALRAQEYLKKEGVEAFIFMDATWSGDGETTQGIRLVVKPSDADLAIALLRTYDQQEQFAQASGSTARKDSRFYLQAAWLVSILFAFLLGSFLTDKKLEGAEILVGGVFLAAACYFFFVANLQKKKIPV